MIIAVAGLPGTGKSTLARLLAYHLDGLVLDKDTVRHALFGPRHVTYTREQDDLVFTLLTQAATHILNRAPATAVIFDGRTFTRRYQHDQLTVFAAGLRQDLQVIECVCPPDLANCRLLSDARSGRHPAHNRSPSLYQQLAAAAEPIPDPKLVLDTRAQPSAYLTAALTHLTTRHRPKEPSS